MRIFLQSRLRQAERALMRNETVRRIRYGLRNAEEFENLFYHDLMLADRVRMDVYARAIEKHIHPGMRVIDVGTGSGVLACLAAKRGAHVIAIEHGALIERAKELAKSNGLTNIEFVRAHSKEYRTKERVDVLLHEQLGMSLVDEDMVENLGDLRRRVLKPGGLILPGHFEMFVVPVEIVPEQRMPFIHEQRVGGLDFSSFRPKGNISTRGSYDKRLLQTRDVGRVLSMPVRLFELDLHHDDTSFIPGSVEAEFKMEEGQLDGFALFFSCKFDDEIRFTSGPGHPKTHWECQLYRTDARVMSEGDRSRFSLELIEPTNANGWHWRYRAD
jgi:protein arginine N-methyltransferase 1